MEHGFQEVVQMLRGQTTVPIKGRCNQCAHCRKMIDDGGCVNGFNKSMRGDCREFSRSASASQAGGSHDAAGRALAGAGVGGGQVGV